MTTMTVQAGATEAPAGGRPDAPTARLILPAGASREEWLTVRRGGIGGSDVAAILGVDENRGPLKVWYEKAGYEEPETERMRWGKRLEQAIAEGFEEETGLATMVPAGTYAHLDHAWALANPDRWAVEDGVILGPVELKNKGEYVADKWEDVDEAPHQPATQAHWYRGVCGHRRGSWVVALVGGNRLRVFFQETSEELTAEMFRLVGDWWQRHIVEGVRPKADGLKRTTDFLAALYDVKPEQVAEVEVTEARALRLKYASLKDQAKALDDQLTEVANLMRDTAGAAEVVKSGKGVAWSWKANGTFKSKQFREAEPELAARYVRTVEEIDTDLLAAEHPEIYAKYRARVLRVPKKEI
ncbi:YqaJ viral recombinase family protein [Streptomyces sp. SRF1]|uniref:YqaJ viral recombinase family nuclease n=1 Tax=Streptomyces sp. SRF1 TaxID=1549642 RepID=UPI0025B1A89B|nr:YqaJ viral recombinase family protein [Streptomyces sp. SRF1]MDN3056919.1 YqaJ viral recombinase family protein [Streptomyces sp. SRF1]